MKVEAQPGLGGDRTITKGIIAAGHDFNPFAMVGHARCSKVREMQAVYGEEGLLFSVNKGNLLMLRGKKRLLKAVPLIPGTVRGIDVVVGRGSAVADFKRKDRCGPSYATLEDENVTRPVRVRAVKTLQCRATFPGVV